jgi:AraC family transcriptional regulator, regulatory protein of adaptative response / methylated-DNA-[protein]-cysteine methyltransferase
MKRTAAATDALFPPPVGEVLTCAAAAAPLVGAVLVAGTPRGVHHVWLGESVDALLAATEARQASTGVCWRIDAAAHVRWLDQLQAYLAGQRRLLEIPLETPGTAFQRRVWSALQAVPFGATIAYGELAGRVGRATSARAVAGACAANPAALVVPCHRAVNQDGTLAGFRWGLERKQALLELEQGVARLL